jgi:DNA gyrase/topoisomerase IV subunit B
MPRLIEHGYVYIAQPPLYKIKRKKREQYIDNDEQLNRILLELGTPCRSTSPASARATRRSSGSCMNEEERTSLHPPRRASRTPSETRSARSSTTRRTVNQRISHPRNLRVQPP